MPRFWASAIALALAATAFLAVMSTAILETVIGRVVVGLRGAGHEAKRKAQAEDQSLRSTETHSEPYPSCRLRLHLTRSRQSAQM